MRIQQFSIYFLKSKIFQIVWYKSIKTRYLKCEHFSLNNLSSENQITSDQLITIWLIPKDYIT